jgi:CubicO group peptidase (beta-lactamase class C family)
MKLKNVGLLLLIVIVAVNLSACENPLYRSKRVEKPVQATKNENKIKVSTDQVEMEKEIKMEMERRNEEDLKKKIREYLLAKNLSGSVLVVKNKHVLFQEGVGYANEEKKLLNQPSTTYPIGSITKMFVATSIMMLQDQHKLDIQDPISKYIPNFPNGNQIKIYNFLTHTSGIPAYHWHNGDTTPLKLVQTIQKSPVKFQPGAKWDYLDANYIVLGYLVEKVSGTPLHEFIQKNIIDKVHLNDTGFITHDHPVPYTSESHLKKENNVETFQSISPYPLFSCGDIYSTPYNLYLFDQALMDGELVSKESLAQMMTPSTVSKYGLGMYNNGTAVYSIGVLGGWYSMHSYYYNDKTSVVLLLNEKRQGMVIDYYVNDIYQIVKESPNLDSHQVRGHLTLD